MNRVKRILMQLLMTCSYFYIVVPGGRSSLTGLTLPSQGFRMKKRNQSGDNMTFTTIHSTPATRITQAFERARKAHRGVLIPYFMCGYPTKQQSVELILAAA